MPEAPQKPDLDRYADALVALADASGSPALIEPQALELAHLFDTQADLKRFVGDPAVTDAGKASALEEALRGRVAPVLLHFVRLMFDAGVLGEFPRVVRRYLEKAAQRCQRASGLVETAVPLPDDLLARIKAEVCRIMGREVHLLVEQNPELIGGIRVRVGDLVIDGSLQRHLEDFRRAMLG
jgi:F-type H+-transporting ATPase subunit delta